MSDDPLKDLHDFLRENNMSFVFWVCPAGCNGQVIWNEDKTDATCKVCGQKRSDKTERCQCCKLNPAEPIHSCPYAEDVNNDPDTRCNCCPACQHQCLMDI